MRPLSHRFNRARYTLYAPIYDAFIRRAFAGIRQRAIGNLALRPGDHVLVPGCGTGLDFPFLPPGVRLTGGDLTPAMVDRARRAAQASGHPSAALDVLDAERLPFPDASFDAVVLHFIVAVAGDPEAVLREAARVLVPGGQVSLADKFIPRGAAPSRLRRALNRITRLVATEITLDAYPLAEAAGLTVVSDTPMLPGGFFRVLHLRKPGAQEADSSGGTGADFTVMGAS